MTSAISANCVEVVSVVSHVLHRVTDVLLQFLQCYTDSILSGVGVGGGGGEG